MGDLNGITTFITGASSGIGKEIAKKFASEGAEVCVNHPPIRKEYEKANEVKNQIINFGGSAITIKGDVSDKDDVRSMVEKTNSKCGKIDVLVNNAGIIELASLQDLTVELWDRTMAINLRGVFLTSKYFLPDLKSSNNGKIINISSQRGIIGGVNRSHYSASKGGVIVFTRSLAKELSPQVKVNAIAPGPIETGIVELDDSQRKEMEDRIPLGRLGQVNEVVPTAVFLASGDGDYYTGQVLSPDGGHAMH